MLLNTWPYYNLYFILREYMEIGSNGFFHTDLVGRQYMCYLLSRSATLQLILMDGDAKVHKEGIVGTISARDAVAFPVRFQCLIFRTCTLHKKILNKHIR